MNPTTETDRPFFERQIFDYGHVSIRHTTGATGARTFRVCSKYTPARGPHEIDYYEADDEGLALAIARRAVEILGVDRKAPVLPEIGATMKRRGFVHTVARPIHGGFHVLGDTAPDETPDRS